MGTAGVMLFTVPSWKWEVQKAVLGQLWSILVAWCHTAGGQRDTGKSNVLGNEYTPTESWFNLDLSAGKISNGVGMGGGRMVLVIACTSSKQWQKRKHVTESRIQAQWLYQTQTRKGYTITLWLWFIPTSIRVLEPRVIEACMEQFFQDTSLLERF